MNQAERQLRVQSLLDDFLRRNRPPRSDLPREIRDVLAQIHLNPFDLELNVRRLKSLCRIRDNNVSCRFRHVVGTTIKRYVEALRMEAASYLLRDGGLSVFDVAVAVGYFNLQTFYRAFERHYGCTPAVHRRRLCDPIDQRPHQGRC
jgi:AraC-like DNA-binding protein